MQCVIDRTTSTARTSTGPVEALWTEQFQRLHGTVKSRTITLAVEAFRRPPVILRKLFGVDQQKWELALQTVETEAFMWWRTMIHPETLPGNIRQMCLDLFDSTANILYTRMYKYNMT